LKNKWVMFLIFHIKIGNLHICSGSTLGTN
jgi:hypothetical protein